MEAAGVVPPVAADGLSGETMKKPSGVLAVAEFTTSADRGLHG